MWPQVILVGTLAVLGVLTALPLGEAGSSSWPCCDDCGICNRMFPPKCKCNDISVHGCHRECKKCVINTLITAADVDAGVLQKKHPGGGGGGGGISGPFRTYRCADMLTNFCDSRCTPTPAAAFLGEVFI